MAVQKLVDAMAVVLRLPQSIRQSVLQLITVKKRELFSEKLLPRIGGNFFNLNHFNT